MSNVRDLVKEIEIEPRGLHIYIEEHLYMNEDDGLSPYAASCDFDDAVGYGKTPREALNELLEGIDLYTEEPSA